MPENFLFLLIFEINKNIAKSKDEVSWRCVKRDCVLKCTAVLKTKSTLMLCL